MNYLSEIWQFIQTQILGMKWLNDGVGWLLMRLGVDIDQWIGGSIHFFIYDVIKIFLLLSVLIFSISYIQSFYPPERTKRILGRYKGLGANASAAFLGILTPFCSCSSIPLFIGFSSAGLPVGVTFSFLIASPLIDLGSLVLLMSIFGPKVALVYIAVGWFFSIIAGTIIDKTGMSKYVESFVTQANIGNSKEPDLTKKDRVNFAWTQLKATARRIAPYVFIGIGIGALIHNVIPQDWVETILGSDNPFSVFIAAVVGIPMYANIFGTIPVAQSLFLKGAGLGTVLAFMMSVTALSLPSMIMLKRAVKMRLLVTFISIVAAGIVTIGFLFNILQTVLV